MKTLNEIQEILKQQKEFLEKKYKIKEIGILGSYVRGHQKYNSDVDMLVEFEEVPFLLKIELENYLSDVIGLKVDLVKKNT